ncbi:hypothetical protein GCM10027062_19330 [Nocardioides hungaricus]
MRRLLLVLALALGTLATVPAPAPAAAPQRDAQRRVQVYDYDLGDAAFRVPGFNAITANGMPAERLAPLELTGRVYAPAGAAGQRLPLAVLAHGLFWTCANDATGKLAPVWPCRGRMTSIRSDRGYDYLGRTLAARGMVVVSVGMNGVNAGEMGEVGDRARGQVVYQHLRMWRRLVRTGAGPLAGAFTERGTRRPANPDFRGAVDLRNVGLLGHSRGGRGVMWAAADVQRDRVPRGVRLRAVFGMAAAEPPFLDRRARRLRVSRVPVMTWIGGCDATGDDSYNRLARRGDNPVNIAITVAGANHNNLNERWAAESGRPGGTDDATHPDGQPGRCYAADGSGLQETLGYRPEQRVAATYVGAFFARYLQGDRRYDAVLTGEQQPVSDLARVDVRWYQPRQG